MASVFRHSSDFRRLPCLLLLSASLSSLAAQTADHGLFDRSQIDSGDFVSPIPADGSEGIGASAEPAFTNPQQGTDPGQNGSVQQPDARTGGSAGSPDRRDLIFYPGDTERPLPLIRKLGQNIFLDQKAIWTSPFRMRRSEAKWWIGGAAITGALIATDRRTIRTFENTPRQIRWGNNVSQLGASYTVLPVMAGFYIYGAAFDNQKARETGVLGGEALLDALITVEVLKVTFQRNRPNASEHPGNFWGGGASFPSGHSIESWALASVIAHEYRNRKFVPYLAFGLAGFVSCARFAAQQHYASDIFVGAAAGFFIGRYVVNTHEAHAGHHHGLVTPIVRPADRTFGLSYRLAL